MPATKPILGYSILGFIIVCKFRVDEIDFEVDIYRRIRPILETPD